MDTFGNTKMSIEEKAKRYDEALNWMRELYPGLHGATKEDAEHFFPELRESEDERIRKWLVEYFKAVGNSWIHRDISCEQILAYLERQKEQKPMYNLEIPAGDVAPAEEDGPFDEDEFLEGELSAFLQNYDKEYDDDAAVSDVARHFYEIGKKQKEQKPAQTSEEKEYIRTIKSLISDFIRDKQPEDVTFYQKIYDWLDGRHIEQKPTEWSEDDEKRLKQLIYDTEHIRAEYEKKKEKLGEDFNNSLIRDCDEQISWLKSLRPSWKPSDEQMDALERTIHLSNFGLEEDRRKALVSLYEQLKKLM